MDWQLSQPGVAPIGQPFRAFLAAAVERIEHVPVRMWEVVRECSFRRSRQSQRALPRKRFPVFIRPQQPQGLPVAVEEVAASTIESKRRLSYERVRNEATEPMRPAKRRHLDIDIETPWKDQAWLKEHVKDLTPPQKSSPRQIITPRDTPVIRRSPPKRFGYEPRYSPYTRSPRRNPPRIDKRIHLYRDDPHAMQFMWTGDDEDEDLSSPEKPPTTREEPSHEASVTVEGQNDDIDVVGFTPIRLALPKEPSPPPADSDTDWDPANEVDPEEAKKYRNFLRALPESVDERGFKVPIDGIISPETQVWNEHRKRDLELQEAAAAQVTPSKVPQLVSSSTSPHGSSRPQKNEAKEGIFSPFRKMLAGAISLFAPGNEQKQSRGRAQESDKNESPVSNLVEEVPKETTAIPAVATMTEEKASPSLASQDGANSPALTTREETKDEPPATAMDAIPEEAAGRISGEKSSNPFETPAKQFASLTLLDTKTPAPNLRTPKATFHQSIKTDRKTRHQKLLEEREARKDAYRIVPLSASWDARVRHAVQLGVKDDEGYTKYNDTDLARVVPQYARGGLNDNWLNDAVVNDYVSLCVKHGNKDDRATQVPSYASFSSQTWQKIQTDPKSVPSRWWKRQGIQGKRALECEKIFMPINTGNHWTLAVVEPKIKTITVYNSLGFYQNQSVAEKILIFLKQEVGVSISEEEWTINAQGVSPQQRNSDDCGVFSITTARQIVLGKMEKEPYAADIIPVQRKRIVAELVNDGLLSTEESQGDATIKPKGKK